MDPIDRLFPEQMLIRLAERRRPEAATNGRDIAERHAVLGAAGPDDLSGRRALRGAWAAYLSAAEDCGLLKDGDLVARLVGDDDDGFRSALAECAAAWFLRELGFTVRPRPDPPEARGVDFLGIVGKLNLYVEVKAPYVPQPKGHWRGNDAGTLVKCIKDADRNQLKRGRANLLLLVPALRTEIYNRRGQLLKATIGEHAWAVPVSLDGSPPPPAHGTFLQTGKLARPRSTREGAFTTDLTRISAVMSLEHKFRFYEEETAIAHSAVVVHNPFASVPIASDTFGELPQWVNGDGKMWWSDGYRGP